MGNAKQSTTIEDYIFSRAGKEKAWQGHFINIEYVSSDHYVYQSVFAGNISPTRFINAPHGTRF